MNLIANTYYIAASAGDVTLPSVPEGASGIADILTGGFGKPATTLLRNRAFRYTVNEGVRFGVFVQPLGANVNTAAVGISFDGDAVQD